jgi:hypothetical protein
MNLFYLKINAAAARLFRQAFTEQPSLADDLEKRNRCDAARAAALAGCGQGKDADKLDTKERALLRRQALDWLWVDLKAYRQMREQSAGAASPMIRQWTRNWWANTNVAGVRDDKALAKLPEAERKEWQKLWQEAAALLAALQFDIELSRVLEGKAQPYDFEYSNLVVRLARQCLLYEKFNVAARLFNQAFSEQPRRADHLEGQERYDAARAAALAGCGQGKDADMLDSKERDHLRLQALDWLRADLKAYRQLMEEYAGAAGPMIGRRMEHWLQDEDFAGTRGDKALAKLPEVERKEWQKLWQEVGDLRQRAAQQPKAASSARP